MKKQQTETEKREVKIITVTWGGWQKRLHFTNPKDTEKEFERVATIQLNKIGDKAKDWPKFLAAAIKAFEKHGFERFKA